MNISKSQWNKYKFKIIGFRRFKLVPKDKYQIIKNKKISFREPLIMNLPDKPFDMPKENNLLVVSTKINFIRKSFQIGLFP